MRIFWACALLAGVAITACAPKPQKPTVSPYETTVKEDCYTVDLFTPAEVQTPHSDVPAEWAALLGQWGGGAWEGKWCHDLYVLEISPDGKVDMISAHAPFPELGRDATAFRRKGYITKNNSIRVLYKNVIVEYRLEGGRLLGERKEGTGVMRIKLSQQNSAA